jgi:hypothetical protein
MAWPSRYARNTLVSNGHREFPRLLISNQSVESAHQCRRPSSSHLPKTDKICIHVRESQDPKQQSRQFRIGNITNNVNGEADIIVRLRVNCHPLRSTSFSPYPVAAMGRLDGKVAIVTGQSPMPHPLPLQ